MSAENTTTTQQTTSSSTNKRKFFTERHDTMDLPNLIETQNASYKWFLDEGLNELFDEISPIEDFTGKDLELHFLDYYLDEEKNSEKTAKERNTTFEAPLRAKVRLVNKRSGEIKDQEVFLGDFPIMTNRGTFVVNGVERVVVAQLIRSPGVFFTAENIRGRKHFGAKVIPNRGAWLEIETDVAGVISVKIDRKRKVPISALLRAFGFGTNEEITALFKDIEQGPEEIDYIAETIKKDPSRSAAEGLKEVYKRVRPGDLATSENARQMLESMFFDFDRYDFGRVGRYKLNQRLGLDTPNNREHRTLDPQDMVRIIKEIIRLNIEQGQPDDIDHLGNRRVRSVGELIQAKFRVGLARMERIVRDRMSTLDVDTVTPGQLINARPIIASIKEFFTNSQLSQFMDQTNPLSELEHKRRLSAMGPGGLSRERAGFEVRDVHKSHYGRICPIATPEGPNIGLVGHLASYARINEYGFIETPFRKSVRTMETSNAKIVGETLREKIEVDGKLIAEKDTEITSGIQKDLTAKGVKKVQIKPIIKDDIVYLDAFEEGRAMTAPATVEIDENGHFKKEKAQVRSKGESGIRNTERIQYVDVSPKQIVSISTSLIPFLEHDDANRALMGSNMQRQAVSSINPQAPIVGTGVEERAARDSGQVTICKAPGKVVAVDARHVEILQDDGNMHDYELQNFSISNQSTAMSQRPRVDKGQTIKEGDVIADGASVDNGELALGQNLLVAFMSWSGSNYEDAIILSERIVQQDRFSSVHIETFSIEVRDTKLGPEVITRDIPNVGEEKLKDLDEEGVIRVGAQVSAGDILVGKITPKGETDLTAEERLLRAIFGEKARDVKDTSLHLPHGEQGKVTDIKIFSRDEGDRLQTGVIKKIQISIAKLRKINVGDKMAGRHGNKGVISKILPVAEMPFLPDGTPVDVILNPLGVVSRMNIGQILETHLGYAASELGYTVASPVLEGVSEERIKKEQKKAGLPEGGKIQLRDGRNGEKFAEPTTVGIMYMLKLHHLVEDKIHQRSIGPYSLVTQQPLGGKAQFGGQRFGEMEVWALEAYGAAHTLQEILTIKSDDVMGRSKTYESIVKGEPIRKPNIPASFNVLMKELMSLGLSVELLDHERQQRKFRELSEVAEDEDKQARDKKKEEMELTADDGPESSETPEKTDE